jgi:hypothetical protein
LDGAAFSVRTFADPAVVAQASNSRMVSSTSVNGQTIKVFVAGNTSPSVNVQQINGNATLNVGTHTIHVTPDGLVSVDGNENSYGRFRELDVTIGDGDSIQIKVMN